MIDTYLSIARDLFSYQELRAVLHLLEGGLWVCLVVIIVAVLLHVLFMLGYQSPLYRKRTPHARWNKQFFVGSTTVAGLVMLVLLGIEWINVNVVVKQIPQSVIHLL